MLFNQEITGLILNIPGSAKLPSSGSKRPSGSIRRPSQSGARPRPGGRPR